MHAIETIGYAALSNIVFVYYVITFNTIIAIVFYFSKIFLVIQKYRGYTFLIMTLCSRTVWFVFYSYVIDFYNAIEILYL